MYKGIQGDLAFLQLWPQWSILAFSPTRILVSVSTSPHVDGRGIHGGCKINVDAHQRTGIAVDMISTPRDAFSWSALISENAKCGRGRQALRNYEEMRASGVKPSSYTFVAALKACSCLQDLNSVKEIHADVVKYGLESDVFVGTMLVDVYTKCQSLVDARSVFERMPSRDVVSWNTMILGCAQMEEGHEALKLYARMQQAGVTPNERTYVSALKACSSLASLEQGIMYGRKCVKNTCLGQVQTIHSALLKQQLETDVFVGNMLVDAYAKCGSLLDARRVFERMPHRDAVSWNAMILGCAQMEEGAEALQLYERMQREGVVSTSRTFVAALKACCSIASQDDIRKDDGKCIKTQCLEKVRAIHSAVVKGRFESDIFVGNMLVDVYAKCGSLVDARRVFERMHHRDVVSWTAIILGYAQMEKGKEALQLYAQMQQEGVVPNSRTFVGALRACSCLASLDVETECDGIVITKEWCLDQVRHIHSDVMKSGGDLDMFVGTMLVDVYAKCGRVWNARSVFDKMPRRDRTCWSSMIWGYANMEQGEEALQLYGRMQQEGIVPDQRTFVGALKACLTVAESEDGKRRGKLLRCLEKVRAIHTDILKTGSESDICVGNMLVDVYAKCGSLVDAISIFEKMPCRDVVSWTSIILGYAQMEVGEAALLLYTRMQQEGVAPNDRTFVGVLKACSNLAGLEEGRKSDGRLLKTQSLAQVRIIHSHIARSGFESNVYVGTMLVDVYAKCGSLVDARHVFEMMPRRDVVSWTAMIFGYAQMEEGELAIEMYTRMQQEGVVPNEGTLVGALKACGSVAGLEKGQEIHASMASVLLECTDSSLASTLIDMYGKCGTMANAQQVFDGLLTRDVVIWNALISGYARRGDSEIVFDSFHRMRQENIQPDGLTFLSLLTVCSHEGLVDKGQKYFQAMSREHGITCTIEHYSCMVDLLGRAGQLDTALEMVETIPCQPNSVVWKCLLGACQKWRNIELGRRAFENAVRLDRNDAAAYVLMSNIYTAANLPKEAEKIHAMRMQTQAWKKPGMSWWTDGGGTVHNFMVGDTEHAEIQHIFAELQDLVGKMNELNSL